MKIAPTSSCRSRPKQGGFSIAETLIGVLVLGIVGTTLFGGLSTSFSRVRVTSEELRANQVLTEKMELIRLCNWNQITYSNGFIPQTFTTTFYSPGSITNLVYSGTVTVTNAPITESYGNQLKQVTVAVSWTSGGKTHQCSMVTFVSPYGIQYYTYK